MSFRSVNEIHNFDFQDACIDKFKTTDDSLVFEVNGLIVEPENSQNENYTKSYADTTKISFKNGKIISGIKDGYKHYDANDKLLEEIEDTNVEVESLMTILKNSKGAFLYAIDRCKESTEEKFVYNICIEFPSKEAYDTCVTKSYTIKVSFTECAVIWERYMNKVQY